MLDVDRITIVGTGLIGGSIGLGLRAAGYQGRIVGVGRRPEPVERARQLGCVDVASTDLPNALADTEFVILATPLGRIPQLLQQIDLHGQTVHTVTDAGSTKQYICDQARKELSDPSIFVGSHPMAGGEQHGPEHAVEKLFVGKPCVITPEQETSSAALEVVQSLWSTLEMRLIQMPADEHDRQVAGISHLPHALAVLLVELASQTGGLDLASSGFRDTTRVASGDPNVWLDIFTTNRDAVIESIDQYSGHLSQFRDLMEDGSEQAILEILRRAKSKRDWWIQES